VVDIQVWNSNDDFLGYSKFEIGQLVGSAKNCIEVELFGGSLGMEKEEYDAKKFANDLK
jgi:hypothetical protein